MQCLSLFEESTLPQLLFLYVPFTTARCNQKDSLEGRQLSQVQSRGWPCCPSTPTLNDAHGLLAPSHILSTLFALFSLVSCKVLTCSRVQSCCATWNLSEKSKDGNKSNKSPQQFTIALILTCIWIKCFFVKPVR